ncbi:MAG: glutathione ABC transporter substrate-binding protein [Planctomycetota bacterium]|nr:MAG: glutathione ABC transporter substrate-binding protein [Planctomycetota bacterium]
MLSPFSYGGGFETKTLVFETLVKRDGAGRLAPALARAWHFEDDDRALVLQLREGARFHDGTPVTASAVALHLRRWVGLPEHAWLRAATHITRWEVRGPHTLVLHTDEPVALLPELCAINPTAVTAPGCVDGQGVRVASFGSGDYRLVGESEAGSVLHYARWEHGPGDVSGPETLELRRLGDLDGHAALDLLEQGQLDVLMDSWAGNLPRERLAALARDRRFVLREAPGSGLLYLSFRSGEGAPSRELRRAVAATVDREQLVRDVERGRAAAAWNLAAPSVTAWPSARPHDVAATVASEFPSSETLRLILRAEEARDLLLGASLQAQARRHGCTLTLLPLQPDDYDDALNRGAYELRLEQTWGVPYDPWISLVARFLPPLEAPTATSTRAWDTHDRLTELVRAAAAEPREAPRQERLRALQAELHEEAYVIPLYAPSRLAIQRRDTPPLALSHDLYRLRFAEPATP